MSERGKKILENFEKIFPYLTEMEAEKLLSFGEGMVFMVEKRERTKNTA